MLRKGERCVTRPETAYDKLILAWVDGVSVSLLHSRFYCRHAGALRCVTTLKTAV